MAKSYKQIAIDYATACVNGKVRKVGKDVVLAAGRFLADLKRDDLELRTKDPDFVINIIQLTMVHKQGQRLDGTPLLGQPLLLDNGLSTARIAMIVGILGGIVSALSSLVAARMTKRYGVARMLPGFAWLNVVTLCMLLLLVMTGAPAPMLIVMAVVLALSVGAASGLVFGMMMYFVRSGLAALDYGIQSSLFIVTRTLMPAIAGILIDHAGYAGMLGFLSSAALLIAWITTTWRQSLATAMTACNKK